MRTQSYPSNLISWKIYQRGNRRDYRKVLAENQADAKCKGAQIFKCTESEVVASKEKVSKV